MTAPAERAAGVGALALDALMSALASDPAARAVLERCKAVVPPWLADQQTAAVRDAEHLSAAFAGFLGGTERGAPHDDVPAWVRLGLYSTLTRWWFGVGSTCMHDPHPDRPEPVLAAAWRPGLVVCVACAHLLSLRRGSVEDRRCDGCGHVVAGRDGGEPIYPSLVRLGALGYQFGVCESCRAPDEP